MNEPFSTSNKFKQEYLDGFDKVIAARRAECDKMRADYINPEKAAANREKYRADLTELLGWPLTEYETLKNTPMAVKRELRGEDNDSTAYSMQFEVLPELWFYGIYFETKHGEEKHPFVISQHGGSGSPEQCSGFYGATTYHEMTERCLRRGANVFAPQLLMWCKGEAENHPKFDRFKIDVNLKHVGGSIQALEEFALRRVLDYFESEGIARLGHIGMVGLSYGGLYTFMTAALETRITAAYSSCYYNERYKYPSPDWTWKGGAMQFHDAEIVSLIAPRALFLDAGRYDDAFTPDTFEREAERAVEYFRAAGVEDKISYRVHPHYHCIAKEDDGFDFMFKYIG